MIPGPRVTPSDQRWGPIMGHLRGQLIMSWHHYNFANIIVCSDVGLDLDIFSVSKICRSNFAWVSGKEI